MSNDRTSAKRTGKQGRTDIGPAHDDAQEQMAFTFEPEVAPDVTPSVAPGVAPGSAPSSAPIVAQNDVAPAPRIDASVYSSHPNAAAMSAAEMLVVLRDWADRGWLRELDRAFAAFLVEQVPGASALLLLGAALASHQLGRGHVCVTLADTLADPRFALSLPPDERPSWPVQDAATAIERIVTPDVLLDGVDVAQWRAALSLTGLVRCVDLGAVADDAGDAPDAASPLVMVITEDGDARLYLRRYWQYEQQVRAAIFRRVGTPTSGTGTTNDVLLRALLDCLFPPSNRLPDGAADWQKLACALMTRRRFGVVTGGPGTGKTTTVVRLLALLQCLAIAGGAGAVTAAMTSPIEGQARQAPTSRNPVLRIRLAAPTGKAAARLNDAIARAVRSLPLAALADLLPTDIAMPDALAPGDSTPQARIDRLRAAIPTEVTTLHRLLGSRPDSRRFRHDADSPLALDVLVIDEASMVDLEMMAAVLAALPSSARLILLGDKDQLASVEAGAVLGELCARAQRGHYTPETCAWIEATTGTSIDAPLRDAAGTALDQSIAMLRHSHRFTADSGIGRLAQAVNDGDAQALRRIRATPFPDLAYVALTSPSLLSSDKPDERVFRSLAIDGAVEPIVSAAAPAGSPTTHAAVSAGFYGYAHYLRVMREQAPAGVLNAAGTAPASGQTSISDDSMRDAAFVDDGGLPRDRPIAQARYAALRMAYDEWARAVLDAYGSFQLLCALRRGEWGVDGLNERIAKTLHEAGLIALPSMRQVRAPTPWYLGRPVLVTRNDYGLGLMNGDVGITLIGPPPEPARAGRPSASSANADSLTQLRVAFLASDGSRTVKWVLPSRLQAVETVFAMTVHKSQGSEFAHPVLVLPPRLNPILTRELVYTGITRARDRLTLASTARDDKVLIQAIERRVFRASGLMR